jgi:hypothetical protein
VSRPAIGIAINPVGLDVNTARLGLHDDAIEKRQIVREYDDLPHSCLFDKPLRDLILPIVILRSYRIIKYDPCIGGIQANFCEKVRQSNGFLFALAQDHFRLVAALH